MASSLCVRACARICLRVLICFGLSVLASVFIREGASLLEFVVQILYSTLPETSASAFSQHDAL